MAHKTLAALRKFIRRLLSAPFEDLPPAFGDPAPPELREFEAEAEEAQRTVREEDAPPTPVPHHNGSNAKPVRRY